MMLALAVFVALLAVPHAAIAQAGGNRNAGQGQGHGQPGSSGQSRHGVPEFDPAAAGAFAALIASGGVLLARRRSRRP